MAGRGGGRGGRTGLTFNAELLGIGRGLDAVPNTVLDPPPTFPPLQAKVNLIKTFLFLLLTSTFILQAKQPLGGSEQVVVVFCRGRAQLHAGCVQEFVIENVA